MRSDMSKVVVERRRLGQMKKVKHFRQKQSIKNNPEDAPTKEPLRNKRERTKSFNEHLKPLRRWLLKNVGRPWDKVKSEALEGLGGGRGTLQNHVIGHMNDYVTENVTLIDGAPYETGRGGLTPVASSYRKSYKQLYVCPKSGLLKIAKPPRKKKRERFEVRRISEFKLAMFSRGCWHEVITKNFPFMNFFVEDAYFGTSIDAYHAQQTWGKYKGAIQYCVALRPLRKSEIRMLPFSTDA